LPLWVVAMGWVEGAVVVCAKLQEVASAITSNVIRAEAVGWFVIS
jgi:hypothetical protein